MPLDSWTAVGTDAGEQNLPYHTALLQQLAKNAEYSYSLEQLRQYSWASDYEQPHRLGSIFPAIVPILWPLSKNCTELELDLRYKRVSADVNVGLVVISDSGISPVQGQVALSSTSITTSTFTLNTARYKGDIVVCLYYYSELDSTETKTTGHINSADGVKLVASSALGATGSYIYAVGFDSTDSTEVVYAPSRRQILFNNSPSDHHIFLYPPLSVQDQTNLNSTMTSGSIRTTVQKVGELYVYGITVRETKAKTTIQLNSENLALPRLYQPAESPSDVRVKMTPQMCDRTYIERTAVHHALTNARGYRSGLVTNVYQNELPYKLLRNTAVGWNESGGVADACVIGVYDAVDLLSAGSTTEYPRRRLRISGLFTIYNSVEPHDTAVDLSVSINDMEQAGTAIDSDTVTVRCRSITPYTQEGRLGDIRAYVNGIGTGEYVDEFGVSSVNAMQWNTLQGSWPLLAYRSHLQGQRFGLAALNWYKFDITVEDSDTLAALISDYKADAANHRSGAASTKLERLLMLNVAPTSGFVSPDDPELNDLPAQNQFQLISWYVITEDATPVQ